MRETLLSVLRLFFLRYKNMGQRIMSSDKLSRFANAFEWLLSTDGRMALGEECGPAELQEVSRAGLAAFTYRWESQVMR